MRKSLFLSVWFLTATLLCAQSTPTYRQVLDGLAKPAPGSAITLPDAFFAEPDTAAAGKLQRGVVLYAAAGRAKELHNRSRSPELIAAAKPRLQSAATNLSGGQKAQAHYTLGQIAEQYEGDLAGAESAYQQAVAADANHTQAQQALARVQRLRNP